MTPARWLTYGARVALFIYAVAGIAILGLERASLGARVPKAFVTGRAAAAIGDSGLFASPVLPRGARLTLPHADAESAAVAFGYWDAPSVQDLTALPDYEEIPLERRRFCGRTYYVQPIVAMPDTNVIRQNTSNVWEMWAPTWVMPICDDRERVRSTVTFSDLPVGGLRVIQSARPGAIPRLVTPGMSFPHIGQWSSRIFPQWERGIAMTPETAVNVAMARLRSTGARVAEVPEAFTLIVPPNAWKRAPGDSQPFSPTAECSRWRLTLDRAVALRGLVTGQIVHTSTVYVTRGNDGCRGTPALEIPKPSQPTSIPLVYMIPHEGGRDSLPSQQGRPTELPRVHFGWTRVRVVEPVAFEPAGALR